MKRAISVILCGVFIIMGIRWLNDAPTIDALKLFQLFDAEYNPQINNLNVTGSTIKGLVQLLQETLNKTQNLWYNVNTSGGVLEVIASIIYSVRNTIYSIGLVVVTLQQIVQNSFKYAIQMVFTVVNIFIQILGF